jgi:hypothetical protein
MFFSYLLANSFQIFDRFTGGDKPKSGRLDGQGIKHVCGLKNTQAWIT